MLIHMMTDNWLFVKKKNPTSLLLLVGYWNASDDDSLYFNMLVESRSLAKSIDSSAFDAFMQMMVAIQREALCGKLSLNVPAKCQDLRAKDCAHFSIFKRP